MLEKASFHVVGIRAREKELFCLQDPGSTKIESRVVVDSRVLEKASFRVGLTRKNALLLYLQDPGTKIKSGVVVVSHRVDVSSFCCTSHRV